MINIDRLKQIEQTPDLKLKYIKAWGGSNVMYIPVIIMVAAIFWLFMVIFFLAGDVPVNDFLLYIGIGIVTAVFGFLWFRKCKQGILKKYRDTINDFPVCLAKIVMGNDNQHIYYCIYTTGKHRMDMDWLSTLSDKIWNVEQEPNSAIRNKIESMFRPTMLATTNHDSILLPVEFTGGEKVYKKILGLPQNYASQIINNGGFIPVIYFNKISVPMIREEDLK